MQPENNAAKTDSADTHICVVCGKSFVAEGTDTQCCSPVCRTMRIAFATSDKQKQDEQKRREELAAMSQPPRFNLNENPKARAQWFMSLPDEFKPKFLRFLSAAEREYAKDIAQKKMSEERLLSGFFVKKGKIVEVRAANEEQGYDNNEQEDTRNTEGTDDPF